MPRAQQSRQQQPDGILHKHVDHEEEEVVPQRAPEPRRVQRVCNQAAVILKPYEDLASALLGSVEAQSQRVEQRIDHERGINSRRRQDEDDDMEGKLAEAPHTIGHRRDGPAAKRPPRRWSVRPVPSWLTSFAAACTTSPVPSETGPPPPQG